ncbi:lactonase family protein [Halocynthiibacter sp. C4]|uniref:lactonase family protein n=1 Tax=Halocynthiibacter sp. C4 TaxID=2992758 RepID=UPI00237A732B|nr:lactonase family protein [Halocynthiibacter sp. C4]MDE0591487.1 lactonase family protein [Halocynthiibacter sp. C4]
MSFQIYAGSLTRPMPQYESASGEGITLLSINDAGTRTAPHVVEDQFDDTIWIVRDRAGEFLYSTFETSDGDQSYIAAFRIEKRTGDLTLINSQPTGGNEACHATLSSDGRYLLVANYNGEGFEGLPDQSMTVFPVLGDGGLGEPTATIRYVGRGPRQDRQTRPHAHCVEQRPGTNDFYVADLGLDRIAVYALSHDGQLIHKPGCDVTLEPGDGPRHLVFSADGKRMFVVCELNAKVLSFALSEPQGQAHLIDSFGIGASNGIEAQPSGIVLTKTADTLFVALRGCDEILTLPVTSQGLLLEAVRSPCGGQTPRDIKLLPTERHLLVANQNSSTISVLPIDKHTCAVADPVTQIEVGTPMVISVHPLNDPTHFQS